MTPILITSHEQLDSLVAEKVAGWRRWDIPGVRTIWHSPKADDGFAYKLGSPPPFSRSADAVLPELDKFGAWVRGTTGTVTLYDKVLSPAYPHKNYPEDAPEEWMILQPRCCAGEGRPFPLAACLCLLRAKGLQVELAPDFK